MSPIWIDVVYYTHHTCDARSCARYRCAPRASELWVMSHIWIDMRHVTHMIRHDWCITAYCIWSVVSSFSILNSWSSSLGLFHHVPLKRDQGDWAVEKRPRTLRLEIELKRHSTCNRLYIEFLRSEELNWDYSFTMKKRLLIYDESGISPESCHTSEWGMSNSISWTPEAQSWLEIIICNDSGISHDSFRPHVIRVQWFELGSLNYDDSGISYNSFRPHGIHLDDLSWDHSITIIMECVMIHCTLT